MRKKNSSVKVKSLADVKSGFKSRDIELFILTLPVVIYDVV